LPPLRATTARSAIKQPQHAKSLTALGFLSSRARETGTPVSNLGGSITKSGNAHARRLLTEASWNYRFKPRIGYRAQARQEGLDESIRAIAWKAQPRLTARFSALTARGIQVNKVCVAVARELTGFIWAIARACQPRQP